MHFSLSSTGNQGKRNNLASKPLGGGYKSLCSNAALRKVSQPLPQQEQNPETTHAEKGVSGAGETVKANLNGARQTTAIKALRAHKGTQVERLIKPLLQR